MAQHKVRPLLETHGFVVLREGRIAMTISGPASAFVKAFGLHLEPNQTFSGPPLGGALANAVELIEIAPESFSDEENEDEDEEDEDEDDDYEVIDDGFLIKRAMACSLIGTVIVLLLLSLFGIGTVMDHGLFVCLGAIAGTVATLMSQNGFEIDDDEDY